MAVPPFQEFMLPFLQHISDEQEHKIAELFQLLAEHFGMTEGDLKELLPSGRETRFKNRVYWARVYLGQAKVLDSTGRGRFKITDRGLRLLKTNPKRIDIKLLGQYAEFQEFKSRGSGSEDSVTAANSVAPAPSTEQPLSAQSPEEQLESTYQLLRQQLAQSLLTNIRKSPPAFFEQLVVDLLVAMGYGGSRVDAGQALGQSGDGGIDGIIKEDRLGLDIVYLQAKRWEAPVGSPEVRNFTGSLEGHGAQKGVLITISKFTKDAIAFATRLQQKKLVLIDGEKLTELMMDFSVGVNKVASYTVQKIDPDYFGEE
ncbi:MAG: restriction endonuclease [Rubrivivax sp.]|nr:restriction endonuclease [Rubrivivax sp.]